MAEPLPVTTAYWEAKDKVTAVRNKYAHCFLVFPGLEAELNGIDATLDAMHTNSLEQVNQEVNSHPLLYGVQCAAHAYFGEDLNKTLADKYGIEKKLQDGDAYAPILAELDRLLAQSDDCYSTLFDVLTTTTNNQHTLINEARDAIPGAQDVCDRANRMMTFISELAGCGETIYQGIAALLPASEVYATDLYNTTTAIKNAKAITDDPAAQVQYAIDETLTTTGLRTQNNVLSQRLDSILHAIGV